MVAWVDTELPPPKNTSNMYIYLEQFLLRDNCDCIEKVR